MATLPRPAPSLGNMPEEILNQIVASLLPLKWYSLSVLFSLSRTNSYLRRWLMENDSLWHLALLGRGMGRPLHTIPGYQEIERAQNGGVDDGGLHAIAALNGGTQFAMLRMNHLIQAQINAEILRDEERKAFAASVDGLSGPSRASHAKDSDQPPASSAIFNRKATCYRELALQVYLHEMKCMHCKVADSKLSHYYVSDGDMLNPPYKLGLPWGIVRSMQELLGGSGWGTRKICKGHFERVVLPDEASNLAVRTSKFFAGYDFFGFCAHTLPIRLSCKAEPLTTPPLARIEVMVFCLARLSLRFPMPELKVEQREAVLISSFVVENWGGVTLGDFQYAFEKWASQPLTEQEAKDFAEKCYNGHNGKKTTRVGLIPPTYIARLSRPDRPYEVNDIRPLGSRVEAGRCAVFLGGERQTPS